LNSAQLEEDDDIEEQNRRNDDAATVRLPVLDDVECVSEFVMESKSLKLLEFSGNDELTDAATLLEHALYSESLEEIYLADCSVGTNAESHHLTRSAVNHTVRKIRLTNIRVGGGFTALLSGFKGIESIDFSFVTSDHHRDTPVATTAFAGLEKLVRYEEFVFGVTDQHMRWLAANLGITLSLQHVKREYGYVESTTVLPSLRDIVTNCRFELTLRLHKSLVTSKNVEFLCSGIEAAQSLTHLTMEVDDGPSDYFVFDSRLRATELSSSPIFGSIRSQRMANSTE
jgi:hypothetical protein